MGNVEKHLESFAVLNSLDHPVICVSQDGFVRYLNASARKLPEVGEMLAESRLCCLYTEAGREMEFAKVLENTNSDESWRGVAEFSIGEEKAKLRVSLMKHTTENNETYHVLSTTHNRNITTDSEDFYRLLIEKQGDMVVVVDRENRFLFVSPSYCEAFGKSKEELLGNTFLPLVHDEDLENTQEGMKDLFKPPYRCDIIQRAMTKDGWRWMQWVDTAVIDEKGQITSIIGVGRDINDQIEMQNKLNEYKNNLEELVEQRASELIQVNKRLEEEIIARKKNETELVRSEQRLKGIIKSLNNCAIAVVDRNGLYLNSWADKRFEKDTGMKGEDLVGKYVKDHFPPDTTAEIMALIEKILSTGESQTFEYKYPTKDGILWHESNVSPFIGKSDEECVVSFIQDVTKRKNAENVSLDYQKQLQTLATNLTMAEERERRHIAQLLHDDIGQNLALIKIRLKMLDEKIENEDLKQGFSDIVDILSDTIRDTRSLTFDLSPPILYELGFEEALRWLLEKYSRKLGIAGSFFQQGGTINLSDNAKGLLFHVVRELLVNVSKYAKAKNIRLEIENTSKCVRITLEDDGIGFKPKPLERLKETSDGYGLFSIKERLKRFNGGIMIKSTPGQGTKIVISLPHENQLKQGLGETK